MSPKKRTPPLIPPPDPPFIELLIGDELESLFSQGFVSECLDPMGYDLRLGSEVRLVTRGKTEEMSDNEEIEIYPGESVIVKTEEVLNLPDNVFALGSPKMKLLVQGLWAHGGKTDPGYNLPLNLGFQNVGSKPCILRRRQKIFHLSFFKIHGKAVKGYTGRGPGFPDLQKSPLEDSVNLNEHLLEEVKRVEGIKSFRVCTQILNLKREMGKSYKIPIFGLIAILLILSLQYMKIIADEVSFYLTTASAIISIVAYVYDWVKKRVRKT
jgi:deoxycytidine triphosphate deaminase